MRTVIAVLVVASISVLAIGAKPPQAPAGKNLSWAYAPAPEKNEPPIPDGPDAKHLPGSTKAYTQMQIDDLANPPDWYPDEHGALPQIVANGSANKGFACGSCHLMSGLGHPESSALAAFSAEFIVQQMADFKSGVRKDPARMNGIAQSTSDEDVQKAAEYFASVKPVAFGKVMEADMVPKSYVGPGRMRFAVPDGGMEPIGNRIIELPEDVAKARSRDPHSEFIAYVPTGSIAKGAALARTGGSGKTLACDICHGEGLKGIADAPRLAGVHPIYLVRQLYGFQTGTRNGAAAQLMKPVVANLTDEDILNLAAYAASLAP
jgi:cytochrome c553